MARHYRSTSGRQETAKRKYLLSKRDGNKCGICGETIKDIKSCNVDHKIPYSISFDSSMENLQLAHVVCNARKGSIILQYNNGAKGE